MNARFTPWIVTLKFGPVEYGRYFACASVRKHLENTLDSPEGEFDATGTLDVVSVTPNKCVANIMLGKETLKKYLKAELRQHATVS